MVYRGDLAPALRIDRAGSIHPGTQELRLASIARRRQVHRQRLVRVGILQARRQLDRARVDDDRVIGTARCDRRALARVVDEFLPGHIAVRPVEGDRVVVAVHIGAAERLLTVADQRLGGAVDFVDGHRETDADALALGYAAADIDQARLVFGYHQQVEIRNVDVVPDRVRIIARIDRHDIVVVLVQFPVAIAVERKQHILDDRIRAQEGQHAERVRREAVAYDARDLQCSGAGLDEGAVVDAGQCPVVLAHQRERAVDPEVGGAAAGLSDGKVMGLRIGTHEQRVGKDARPGMNLRGHGTAVIDLEVGTADAALAAARAQELEPEYAGEMDRLHQVGCLHGHILITGTPGYVLVNQCAFRDPGMARIVDVDDVDRETDCGFCSGCVGLRPGSEYAVLQAEVAVRRCTDVRGKIGRKVTQVVARRSLRDGKLQPVDHQRDGRFGIDRHAMRRVHARALAYVGLRTVRVVADHHHGTGGILLGVASRVVLADLLRIHERAAADLRIVFHPGLDLDAVGAVRRHHRARADAGHRQVLVVCPGDRRGQRELGRPLAALIGRGADLLEEGTGRIRESDFVLGRDAEAAHDAGTHLGDCRGVARSIGLCRYGDVAAHARVTVQQRIDRAAGNGNRERNADRAVLVGARCGTHGVLLELFRGQLQVAAHIQRRTLLHPGIRRQRSQPDCERGIEGGRGLVGAEQGLFCRDVDSAFRVALDREVTARRDVGAVADGDLGERIGRTIRYRQCHADGAHDRFAGRLRSEEDRTGVDFGAAGQRNRCVGVGDGDPAKLAQGVEKIDNHVEHGTEVIPALVGQRTALQGHGSTAYGRAVQRDTALRIDDVDERRRDAQRCVLGDQRDVARGRVRTGNARNRMREQLRACPDLDRFSFDVDFARITGGQSIHVVCPGNGTRGHQRVLGDDHRIAATAALYEERRADPGGEPVDGQRVGAPFQVDGKRLRGICERHAVAEIVKNEKKEIRVGAAQPHLPWIASYRLQHQVVAQESALKHELTRRVFFDRAFDSCISHRRAINRGSSGAGRVGHHPGSDRVALNHQAVSSARPAVERAGQACAASDDEFVRGVVRSNQVLHLGEPYA